MKFEDLTKEVQDYINQRASYYNKTGEEVYNEKHIFPEEFNELKPNEMIEFLEYKDFSHYYAQSKFPDLREDLDNIILEDSAVNSARRSRTMTPEEKKEAMDDFKQDLKDGDIDDDGILDIESLFEKADNNDAILDIIGLSLPIGMILSGVQVMGKVKNNEIVLNDAPTEFVYDTGKKSIKLAVVGTMLASGSPIIVSGTVAYILYKSRTLLERMFKGIYQGITNPKVVSVLKASGGVIVQTGNISGKVLKKSAEITYNFAKHDKTKSIMKSTAKGVYFSGKATLKSGFYITKLTGKALKWIANKANSTLRKKRCKCCDSYH
jgi:hypothetical protein